MYICIYTYIHISIHLYIYIDVYQRYLSVPRAARPRCRRSHLMGHALLLFVKERINESGNPCTSGSSSSSSLIRCRRRTSRSPSRGSSGPTRTSTR